MSQNTVIILTIAVYAVFIIAVGLLTSRSSSGGVANFTVGKRNAGAWLSAMSYGTAYFSAVMFIGYSGQNGWNFWLWSILIGIGNAVFGSWLAWKVLAKRTRDISRRLHTKSMPQFFDRRFDSRGMKLFSALVIFLFLTPYSASVYRGLTSVCSVVLHMDETLCMIIIAVASAVLLLLGGYLATLRADFVQGIIMMVGVVLLIIYVVRSEAVGGFAGISELWDRMGETTGIRPLSGNNTLTLISMILMTSFGTWGLPQMIHKYYSIRDDKEVHRGMIISTVFAVIVAGGGYFIGSLSHLFTNTLPEGGTDYLVPNMLLSANMPHILLGVILVLLISASVSTLSSVTLTACSTLSMDFVRDRLKKDMTDRHLAWFIRGFCVIFVILSYIIANTKTPIVDMMSYSWGIISGSFLAPYVLSLYSKKINRRGAWAGMLTGFAVAFVPAACKILQLIMGKENAPQWINSLAAMGAVFAVAAMVLSMAATLLVTAVCANKVDEKELQVRDFFYTGTVEKHANV